MKKILLSLFFVFSTVCYSQIGITTVNPQGSLHVDGAKDNNASGAPTIVQQQNDFIVTSEGKVGVGTTVPTSKLEVNGASTNTVAYNAGSSTTIDFSQSNLAYTGASASAGTFTLSGVKDGGTYTLIVQGGTSGTAIISAGGFTTRYANNRATTANTHTAYTILAIGAILYVYTATGF